MCICVGGVRGSTARNKGTSTIAPRQQSNKIYVNSFDTIRVGLSGQGQRERQHTMVIGHNVKEEEQNVGMRPTKQHEVYYLWPRSDMTRSFVPAMISANRAATASLRPLSSSHTSVSFDCEPGSVVKEHVLVVRNETKRSTVPVVTPPVTYTTTTPPPQSPSSPPPLSLYSYPPARPHPLCVWPNVTLQ